jgi:hypothetical protein
MSNVDKNAEILLVNPTSNPGTVNLPLTTTLPYRMLTIKHIGSTSLNGITLAAQGSDSFEDGTTSYVITRQTSFVTFYANASANKWVQVGGTNQFIQEISSLTVNTINGQTYVPVSPANLVSTSLLTSSLVSSLTGLSNLAVTQIVAGTNITLSPIGGQGIVTINASGGGGGSGDVTSTNLTSTTLGLGTLGYISSFSGFLSTNAMFTSSLVVSTISTTNTLFTNALVARSTNLSSVYISDLQAVKSFISSLQVDELILGTGDGWTDTGPLRATYISSLQINTGDLYARTAFLGANSNLNQIRFWGLFGNYNNTILAEMSTGTVAGAQEFVVFKGSSASDRIRMQTTGDIRFEPQVAAREFSTATALATPTMILQSNLVGIATATPIATLDVRGTAFATSISTQQLVISSLNGGIGILPALFASSFVTSTISTTNTLFTNTLVARSTNLSSVYISSLTGVQGYISALTTDSLTIGDGNGWVDFGAARAVVFSSLQENTGSLYATTAYIGNTSTLNQLRYWGLFGNYNNTILAEVSTGTAVGAQEFLIFKGSSASDRIRMQTTGDIRFEPQVAAREFSTATALVTPTMILQSNLVGIATATPIATLDVRGTAFATTLSTQQLFISSINGTQYSAGGGGSTSNLVSTAFLDTTLQSTTAQLQSNVEGWSQYIATNDITLSNGTGIRMVDLNESIQMKTDMLNIVDSYGGYGNLTMGGLLSMYTSSSTENYTVGFSPLATGTISSFFMVRGDGVSADMSALYVSSLYFGNLGGTTAGQLTTDATATDLFWKGSKLNSQTGGGGGGGAIDYVSAFTVSTASLNTSTLSLSDKGPLFLSTNSITTITDMFLNDTYVAQRPPILPVVISTLTTNMELHPEFLGMHFLLTNSDSNFTQLLVRADATFVSNVPDGWYCYLKQFPDSNYFNDGIGAETDLGNVPLPNTTPYSGPSNFMAAMKFIVSGGFKIPY